MYGSRAAGAGRLGRVSDLEEGLPAEPEDLVPVFPRGREPGSTPTAWGVRCDLCRLVIGSCQRISEDEKEVTANTLRHLSGHFLGTVCL